MVAFANEACNLEKIRGGLDIIKEMCVEICDTAELIKEYVKSGFLGKFLSSLDQRDFDPDGLADQFERSSPLYQTICQRGLQPAKLVSYISTTNLIGR
jgi:hypothetical protein